WHAWDGQRWRRDDDGEVVRRAERTVAQIKQEAADEPDSKKAEALFKFAIGSGNRTRLDAMARLATAERALLARSEHLDAQPMFLNVANGTIDLRNGDLREHDRDDRLTKLVPIDYDPDAECPRWDEFLNEVFDGDEDLIAYAQRAVGYSL